MDARAYLEAARPVVERALEASLRATVAPDARHGDATPERLVAAMRHLLFPGGKRLRPALALAGAEAAGGERDAALPVAVAVELVHAYSLIHDDLPCMDDDDERRGRPTVHIAFDEATAVLAGDALLTAAFEALAAGAGGETAGPRLAAIADLARAVGAAGLVGGQIDDLTPAADASQAQIEAVHARKSAALLAASITGGARLAGAGPDDLARLHRAGVAAGVAFQIADDLLDAEEGDACSLLRVMDPGKARDRAEELLSESLDELAGFASRADPLRALLRYAVERDR